MLFKSILLKIETGQALTEKQEKELAKKLGIQKSYLKITGDIFLNFLAILALVAAIFGELELPFKIMLYIIAVLLVILIIYLSVFPQRRKIIKYLASVDTFYKFAFKEFSNFDLYYIGQHKNPHVKILRSKKIYLLTDGYYYVFVEDYFKNTPYKMPFYLAGNEPVYLRTIDESSLHNQIMIINLKEIESFQLTSSDFKKTNVKINEKYQVYFDYFFDQNKYMNEKAFTILTMKNGLTMRLSYTVYEAFKKHMPHKEKQ